MTKNKAGFTAIERQQFGNADGMAECSACGGSGEQSRPAHDSDGVCRGCSGTGAQRHGSGDVIVHHSSKSVEHYTPAPIVDAARATLGAIDLDPASCMLGDEVVQAAAWYGPGSDHGVDGLTEPWMGRVFLNPPGGRVPEEWKGMGTTSNAALWWGRLAAAWQAGEIESAIFIGFTLEILRSAQALDVPQPLDFPICVPSSRIAFDTVWEGERFPSKQPTHANVIVFLPNIEADYRAADPSRWAGIKPTAPLTAKQDKNFRKHFSPIGRCRI